MTCKLPNKAAVLALMIPLSVLIPVHAEDSTDKAADKKVAAKDERKGFSAGFDISDSANARQLGLPIYPGASASRDSEKESAAANLSFWAGTFGAKLVVMKLESTDAPEKVGSFYREALTQYGKVLDCSKAPAEETKAVKGDDSLACNKEKPARNGQLYKAGSKRMQHIVGIEPFGTGTRFQLLYLEASAPD
jgi:hypothetical protein